MDLDHLILRLIKIFDIGLLGVYYFIGAIIFITFFNGFFKRLYNTKEKPIKETSTIILFFQTCFQTAVIAMIAFFVRHFVRNIPFPLQGVKGYDHFRTKEINGGIVIAFAMITVFSDFKNRAVELASRFDY